LGYKDEGIDTLEMFERTEANQKWQARIKQVITSFFVHEESSMKTPISPDNHLSFCTLPVSVVVANFDEHIRFATQDLQLVNNRKMTEQLKKEIQQLQLTSPEDIKKLEQNSAMIVELYHKQLQMYEKKGYGFNYRLMTLYWVAKDSALSRMNFK
jgi:hypothetical protein